jgi:hypothetical protein
MTFDSNDEWLSHISLIKKIKKPAIAGFFYYKE